MPSREALAGAILFASSNHAIGTDELEGAPALYDLDDPRVYDHTVELRPDSLYGVSKVYGEALGRHYVDQHGLAVVCLRIGGMRDPGHPSHPNQLWADLTDRSPETLALRRRMRAVWLSERDCVQLIERSLLTDERWVLVYGISNNPRRFWDIEHARQVLGYAPQDAAPVLIGDENEGDRVLGYLGVWDEKPPTLVSPKFLAGLGGGLDAKLLAHALIAAVPPRLDQLLQGNALLPQVRPDLVERLGGHDLLRSDEHALQRPHDGDQITL